MIDHPCCDMTYNPDAYVNLRVYYSEGRFRSNQGEVPDIDMAREHYYIRSEYDAWQEYLKKQEDDKAPRVGESLQEFWQRQEPKEFTFNTLQRWIEANFVRKEGR